jgi:hypothetical protein
MPFSEATLKRYPRVDVSDIRKYRHQSAGFLHDYSSADIAAAVQAVESQFDVTLPQPFDIMRLGMDQLITFLRTLLADESIVAAAQSSSPTDTGVETKLSYWKELPVDDSVLAEIPVPDLASKQTR